MNSFDIFDTLIGRWYMEPSSIFYEMELELQIPNFAWYRQHAEEVSKDKTFDGIYKTLATLLNLPKEILDSAKEMEFDLECRRTFPIVENVKALSSNFILISDTYFSPDQLRILLDVNGIEPSMYKEIYSSYDGKSSGRIWKSIKPSLHIGDNFESDYMRPKEAGILSALYDESKLNKIETELANNFKLPNLAKFSRMIRLSNPYSNAYRDVWNEQADLNIPLLVLLSHYFSAYSNIYPTLLFTQRDCANLYTIFSALFPDINAEPFFSSRELYLNPTRTFIEYARKYIDKSIIIDLQGTGQSFYKFFYDNFGKGPKYFPVVYSDLNKPMESENYLVHRKDGFSDKIERLNYITLGKVIDIEPDLKTPVRRGKQENSYIYVQKAAVDMALTFLSRGYNLDIKDAQLTDPIKYLLNLVETDCKICQYVNHEET